MATALFEPQTASFGELVLRPRPRPLIDFSSWSPAAEDENSRVARNHLFITIGFVAAFMTFLSALYVADAAAFPQGYAHAPTTATATAPVDYD